MLSRSCLFTLIAPASVLGAAIAPQGHLNLPTATGTNAAPSPVLDVTLFKGNANGPCNDLSLEIAAQRAEVFNPTGNLCFSTQGLHTTCIGRRTGNSPGPETVAQTYEAANGGVDNNAYQCTVTGYQQDGCPAGTGSVAQYHQANATWSWDHETRIRDDFPGKLWSILSFQMSCKP